MTEKRKEDLMLIIEEEVGLLANRYARRNFSKNKEVFESELKKIFDIYSDEVEYYGFTSNLGYFGDIQAHFKFKGDK